MDKKERRLCSWFIYEYLFVLLHRRLDVLIDGTDGSCKNPPKRFMKNSWISIFSFHTCMLAHTSLIHFSFSTSQQTHERLRPFQMNGGPQQSFEETIHRVSVHFHYFMEKSFLFASSWKIENKFSFFFIKTCSLKYKRRWEKRKNFRGNTKRWVMALEKKDTEVRVWI